MDAELASILLDEGKTAEAASVARRASAFLRNYDAASDQAAVHLALVNAYLAQHRIVEARQAFAAVLAISSRIHDRELQWSIEMAAARLKAATGRQGARDAENQLMAIARDAREMSFVNTALTARLQLAQMEMAVGDQDQARIQLEVLKRESSQEGFRLIASEAAVTH